MGKKLFLFAAAAVALASCTETDLSGDTSFAKESTSDAIQFSAKAGNSGVTRTVTTQDYVKGTIGNADNTNMGITKLASAGFGVFAYYTGANDYVTNPATQQAPDFMYNQKLEWSESNPTNMWIYSPVKYWPNGIDADNLNTEPSHTAAEKTAGKVSFFAYAPYKGVDFFDAAYAAATDGKLPTGLADETTKKSTTADNGIKAMTTNEFKGNVWVKYLMPNAKQSEAVDLLWGLAGKAKYDETDGVDPAFTIGESYNLNLTKQTVGERVSFLFKHALAKVGGATTETEDLAGEPTQCGFKVVADVDANNGDNQDDYFPSSFKPEETLITIKNVKIQDGASAASSGNAKSGTESTFNTFGWFNIETGSWCNETGTYGKDGTTGATYNIEVKHDDADVSTDATYSLNEKIREAADYGKSGGTEAKLLKDTEGKVWSDANPTGVTTTPQPLFAKENVPGLLVIPAGTTSNELYVTVDYFVRTADPNLKKGFTEVEQIITNKVSLGNLKPNKYYTIIMHIGLTSVKFEAKVTDWTLTDDATFDENGNVKEGVDENEESVWLPSNVVNANQWNITGNDVFDAKGGDKTLTVKMNGGTLEYTNSTTPSNAQYTLKKVGTADWLTIGTSDGKITASANTNIAKRTAVVNVTTTVNDNPITTPITIEQKGYTIALTQAAGVVTVKDGDGTTVTNLTTTPTWTVEVYDSNGATAVSSAYTVAAEGTVTINTTGTYTVKVTYQDGNSKTVTETISVTK